MAGIRELVPSMLAQWTRHEIFANNLANVSTPGFKADDLTLDQSLAVTNDVKGSGVSTLGDRALVQWTDRSQGAVHLTGRPLDVALEGPGFLVVDTPAGPRYTRAGVLDVNREGVLVTPGGQPVLGDGGPILVGSDRVSIGPRGDVSVDGNRVGALRVVEFEPTARLLKSGANLFAPTDPATTPAPARATSVVSGALEAANVSVVHVMVNMIDVLRKYETAQRVIQAEDETTRKVTNDIGRVQT